MSGSWGQRGKRPRDEAENADEQKGLRPSTSAAVGHELGSSTVQLSRRSRLSAPGGDPSRAPDVLCARSEGRHLGLGSNVRTLLRDAENRARSDHASDQGVLSRVLHGYTSGITRPLRSCLRRVCSGRSRAYRRSRFTLGRSSSWSTVSRSRPRPVLRSPSSSLRGRVALPPPPKRPESRVQLCTSLYSR